MTDLQSAIDGIHRLCTDVHQISSMTDEMLSWLASALSDVQRLDDSRARTAEAQIRVAQASLREARAVWLEDYVRRSEEICRRASA